MPWYDPETFVGVPYKEGGRSLQDGFDCSGFVIHWYRERVGVKLPENLLAWRNLFRKLNYPCPLNKNDVVLLRRRDDLRMHMGVVVGTCDLLHASGDYRQVVQEPLTRYSLYIRAVVRLK